MLVDKSGLLLFVLVSWNFTPNFCPKYTLLPLNRPCNDNIIMIIVLVGADLWSLCSTKQWQSSKPTGAPASSRAAITAVPVRICPNAVNIYPPLVWRLCWTLLLLFQAAMGSGAALAWPAPCQGWLKPTVVFHCVTSWAPPSWPPVGCPWPSLLPSSPSGWPPGINMASR